MTLTKKVLIRLIRRPVCIDSLAVSIRARQFWRAFFHSGSPFSVHSVLRCGSRVLSLDKPRVMGILNVTPDSFSDGGRFVTLDRAVLQAASMLNAGADIIDIGGESTRPGAAAVSEQEELDRVLPVIEAITSRFNTIVSLDTSKPTIMREGAAAGAGMLNDVRALREPGAVEAAASTGLPVCLMHMLGEPRTMQREPVYTDVVVEVGRFLEDRRHETA